MAFSGRMRELMRKYGKVALGVHLSVSAASITGLYVAINNNVDVESVFQKVGLTPGAPQKDPSPPAAPPAGDTAVILEDQESPPPANSAGELDPEQQKKRNRTAELAASSGGALALAILCNKALFPVRVPITIALTPPVYRFLIRRNLIKNHV